MKALKVWEQVRIFRSPFIRHLIATSRSSGSVLSSWTGKRVTVIPLWVPDRNASANRQESRRRLNITDRFVLLGFGFVVERRGYDSLISAMESFPDDTVLLVAGGPHPLDRSGYYQRLQKLVAQSRCRNRVNFLGYVSEDDLPTVMAAADVVVAPFRTVTGSASLMTALSYGKPIIATDLPPIRELAQESQAILLTTSTEDLAETVRKVREDRDILRYLEEKAELYRRTNTLEHAVQRHLAVYESVLRGD